MEKKQAVIGVTCAVAALAVGIGVSGSMLMAPGTRAYGEEVGMMGPKAAHKQVEAKVKEHQVTLANQKFTLDQLGYHLVQTPQDFEKYKALGTGWNKQMLVTVSTNEETTLKVMKDKVPAITDPRDAGVVFKEGSWVKVPGVLGTAVDIPSLTKQVNEGIARGAQATAASLTKVKPSISDDMAAKTAEALNQKTGGAVLQLGQGVTYPVPRDVASSFVSVKAEGDQLKLVPNKDKISDYAMTLPAKLDKKVVNGSAITDEKGKVLKSLVEPVNGVKVGEPAALKQSIEQAVAAGNFSFPIKADVVKAKLDKKVRRAEVNLTTKHAKFFENDKLVYEFPIGVGRAGTPTDEGSFHVHSQLSSQDMGCSAGYDYCVKNVRWISYFNGGEAFHAAPWTNNLGNPDSYTSHGCVSMRMDDARKQYEFLQVGSPVKVHR